MNTNDLSLSECFRHDIRTGKRIIKKWTSKGKPIYKRVKVGDRFIGFDGAEYEFIEE